MIDVFDVPNLGVYNKVFYPNSSSWQVWKKPSNIKFIYFYVIGSGGAGGGGRTGNINTGGGGGGGASSSISVGLFPAFLLPDTLYIQVGLGLNGAIANQGASSGQLSYVSVAPNTTAINIVMQSGNVSAGGGGGGTSSLAGVGGTAGTIWTYANFPLAEMGMVTSVGGQNGASGGTTVSVGGSVTPTLPISGGAGGGGESSSVQSFAGGNIIGSGFLPTISGGTNNVNTSLVNGNDGFISIVPTTESFLDLPLLFTGGSGGGACHTTGFTGGFGGDGSYGSGGGGGGASYNGTGGSGGRGGDGLILITCW
jgi:hypothetical protein